ncbi:baseplate J/gp47 family protein [Paenibacillus sp. FA6]|uniref:baseplate J/gp47 family protein n=1 Tax=Paenibacillus sp. FA6 TaxID=3413029 RepID=UPI003F65E6F3
MLDRTGFKRRRFEDLFAEMNDKAKETFGEKVNTSERSPLGIILRIFAWFLSKLWVTAEDVYNNSYINSAEGSSLDRLGPHVGITRVLDQYARGTVQLTGTSGHTLAQGFRVATETKVYFDTTEDITFDSTGIATVPVEAVEAGQAGNVAAGSIIVIVNPTPDVTGVTNIVPATAGREKMTDLEFRDLFTQSVAGGGAATIDALIGALLRINSVRAATVIQNYSNEPDVAGRPPHTYQCYVLGGDDDEIAQAIFSTGAGGIESYGDIVKTVLDIGGYGHEVKFSRAEEVILQVFVNLTTNEQYPADGDEQIRSAIVRYIGGEDGGSYYSGLSMGASAVYKKLVSVIDQIEGIEDFTLKMGKDDVLEEDNVTLERYQVAQISAKDIVVNRHV